MKTYKRTKLPIKRHLINLERTQNPAETRDGYLRLDKNENPIGFPEEFIYKIRDQIDSDFLTAYPEVDLLYKKIAKWLGCSQENIYIAAGSDAAIKAAFEVFVEPDDPVILLKPTYAMFYVYAKMFQADLIEIDYDNLLKISVKEIMAAIKNSRPKLVCIANPNSPTGTVISQEEIKEIISMASAQNAIVLLDEAYYLFYEHTSIDDISRYPQLIITRTFSKAFGLASARVGFACAHKNTISYLRKVRPMYETNSFAVRFANILIDNFDLVRKMLNDVRSAKAFLEKRLDELQIPYFKSHANFILIKVGSFSNTVHIQNELYKKKIIIKGGFKNTVLENCIRVTIGNVEQMEIFLKEFTKVYFKLKNQNINYVSCISKEER